jgi:hypothetical protein
VGGFARVDAALVTEGEATLLSLCTVGAAQAQVSLSLPPSAH